jgi:predicted RNA-binding protein with PIN domain
MSLHYLIDAYNVIRSSDWLGAGRLQDQREKLLKYIEEKSPCGRNRVTVVFDGKPGRDWNGWRGPTGVIFSEERDADTEIKERVDAMSNPSQAVVVTNDRAIQIWVRGAGARVVGCDDFLRAGMNRAAPAAPEKPDAEQQKRITDDLRRIWKDTE